MADGITTLDFGELSDGKEVIRLLAAHRRGTPSRSYLSAGRRTVKGELQHRLNFTVNRRPKQRRLEPQIGANFGAGRYQSGTLSCCEHGPKSHGKHQCGFPRISAISFSSFPPSVIMFARRWNSPNQPSCVAGLIIPTRAAHCGPTICGFASARGARMTFIVEFQPGSNNRGS
jgi:hypothetical protein